MKANAEDEIKESKNILNELNSKIEKVNEFNLPKEESKRTLIRIKKLKETNKKYPRTIDKIRKS